MIVYAGAIVAFSAVFFVVAAVVWDWNTVPRRARKWPGGGE